MEKQKKTLVLLYLPEELITQILLRLPVKSLTRFKSVCKSWFPLISNTSFANSHFQLQLASGTHNRRIMFMSTLHSRQFRTIDFEASSLDDEAIASSVSFYCRFIIRLESYPRVHIRGSCRGFLLLHCYAEHKPPMYWFYDIYLWNPSTGFREEIPSSPFASYSDYYTNYYTDFYGFGYDQSTDDYLLVTMSSHSDYIGDPQPQHLEFFSLRANMWKLIKGIEFSYTRLEYEEPAAGFLFNGAIHWFAYCRELRMDVIVAFDLMEKNLFNMLLPNDFERELNNFGLWVFGGFLSLWAEYYFGGDNGNDSNHRIEIWVMKEYKVDSPWTKILVHSFDCISHKYFFPICSTKSGDIIGTYPFTLAKCDDKGQLLEYHSYLNNPRRFEVALYTESLLSL